jgi:hypothetical protein
MIRINNITRGRFGNRILQYNSLMQIANTLNTEASCASWEGHNFFKNLTTEQSSNNNQVLLNWQSVLESDISLLPAGTDYYIDDPAYCLHNVFYKVTKTDPRNFLEIKDEYKKELSSDKVHVGIHFRGTDILGGDGNEGREIHYPRYYINAINLVESEFENTHYHLCTDDLSFNSYLHCIRFLSYKGLKFTTGSSSNYFDDFSTLAYCDVLIASSSTFVVCAGFTGKENKKIIHSKDWIDKNLAHERWHKKEDTPEARKMQITFDNFWTSVYNDGNEFYNAWRFV